MLGSSLTPGILRREHARLKAGASRAGSTGTAGSCLSASAKTCSGATVCGLQSIRTSRSCSACVAGVESGKMSPRLHRSGRAEARMTQSARVGIDLRWHRPGIGTDLLCARRRKSDERDSHHGREAETVAGRRSPSLRMRSGRPLHGLLLSPPRRRRAVASTDRRASDARKRSAPDTPAAHRPAATGPLAFASGATRSKPSRRIPCAVTSTPP